MSTPTVPSIATSIAMAPGRRAVLPGGVTGDGRTEDPQPIVFVRAHGAYLEDVDGNEYVDLHGGYGTAVLGYAHPGVDGAVHDALADGHAFVGCAHVHEAALAERLVDLLPEAERVALCGGGGTDALYHATRLCRAATGRTKIVKVEGGYHGWHGDLGVSTRPPLEVAGEDPAPVGVPNSAGTLRAVTDEVLVVPANDPGALEACFAEHGDAIAGLIVEPALFSTGTVAVDHGYLAAARAQCDRHGAVLVFDEVLSGFRVRLGGAQADRGVLPDLGTYGKAIANGHVISALVGRAAIMDLLAPVGPVFYSGTFNGHPLGVAAAMATLDELAVPGRYASLAAATTGVADRVTAAFADAGAVGCCQAVGSGFSVYFGTTAVRDYRDLARSLTPEVLGLNDALRVHLRDRRVFMQRRVGTNRCFVSAAHGPEELDVVASAFESFIDQHKEELR
jgi:glutamate-1-semialdehyde 2,1-aminomutase